mgnify:CR=1 FL=1
MARKPTDNAHVKGQLTLLEEELAAPIELPAPAESAAQIATISGPNTRVRAGNAMQRARMAAIGGALEVFRSANVDIVPLIATHGGAGGRVAAKAYAGFRDELLERLKSAGKVDGIYLALHGAFIAEGTDDAEGEILAAGHLAALGHVHGRPGWHVFNLGTGRGYSVLELAKAYGEAADREVPIVFAPRRPGDVASCYADPTLAASLMGWKARRGLKEMYVDSWRWQSTNPQGFEG